MRELLVCFVCLVVGSVGCDDGKAQITIFATTADVAVQHWCRSVVGNYHRFYVKLLDTLVDNNTRAAQHDPIQF